MDAEYLLLLDLESESDDDSDSEAIALCHELRQRRFWVADYIKRREDLGEFRLYYELDNERFANYFRMSRMQFSQLQDILATSLTGKNSNWRSSLPVDLKLAVCLRFLNTGDSFRTIAYSYRLGDRTVAKIIVDVTEALYTYLQPMYLPTPSTEQWRTIGSAFGENWHFPNCLGALDGKHVIIKAPPRSGSDFYNYKKTFSTVLLAVVDASYQFVVVDVGSKGRFSDGGIFATSALGHHFRNGTLGIPEDRSICDGGAPMPHVFVADEAFPLQRHLMRPFPGTQLDDTKRVFNYRLSRARRIVENAFGILGARFRVYRRPFECKLETVDKVVKATVVLHNYLGQTGGHNYSDEDISKARQDTVNQLLNLPRIGNNPSSEAFLVRDMFCNYFMNAGKVEWQNRVNRI